mgnify:CR=1 FL=1
MVFLYMFLAAILIQVYTNDATAFSRFGFFWNSSNVLPVWCFMITFRAFSFSLGLSIILAVPFPMILA